MRPGGRSALWLRRILPVVVLDIKELVNAKIDGITAVRLQSSHG